MSWTPRASTFLLAHSGCAEDSASEVVAVVRAGAGTSLQRSSTMFARITSKVGKRGLVASGLVTVALVAVVALLAVTLLPSTGRTAHASGTGGCFAISGPVCTFQNQTADERFESRKGCVVTDTSAEGFDNLVRPGHTPTQTAFGSIVHLD